MRRLSFFPMPEDGETVYSLFCRFAERSGLYDKTILERMTGQKRITSLLSPLPGYLPEITQTMPGGHPWCDGNYIASKYTALPYFVYFGSDGDLSDWATRLANSNRSYPLALALGLTVYPGYASPPHPRFCISCLKESLKSIGFTFFRREHQLPGVAVCWLHGEPLAQGCLKCGPYPISRRALSMPGKCLCPNGLEVLPASQGLPSDLEPFKWLARQSSFMVNGQGLGFENIRKTLRALVAGKGLSRGSLVDYQKLANAIQERYGSDFLDFIGCPSWVGGRPAAWIRRLLNPSAGKKRSPAILFLLVVGTLFDSLEEFGEELRHADSFFPSHARRCIDEEQVSPLLGVEDGEEVEPWVENLRELVAEPPCGIPGVADRLGVKVGQVVNELKRQSLRFPLLQNTIDRVGQKKINAIKESLLAGLPKTEVREKYDCGAWTLTLIELDDPGLNSSHRQAARSRRIEAHKQKLEKLLEENPDLSLTELQEIKVATYEYLQKYDRERLYEHLPKKTNKQSERSSRVDWEADDTKMAKKIKKLIELEKKTCERPKWITSTRLLKSVGLLSKYSDSPDHFPKVTSLLEEHVEPYENQVSRRIRWAVQEMSFRGEKLSVNKLRRVAALGAQVIKKNCEQVLKCSSEFGAELHEKSCFRLYQKETYNGGPNY